MQLRELEQIILYLNSKGFTGAELKNLSLGGILDLYNKVKEEKE